MTTILAVTIGFGAILLMLGTLRWRHHVRGAEEEIKGKAPAAERAGDCRALIPVAADRDRM